MIQHARNERTLLSKVVSRGLFALACIIVLMAGQCPAGTGTGDGEEIQSPITIAPTSDGIVFDAYDVIDRNFENDYLLTGSAQYSPNAEWIALIRFGSEDLGDIPDGVTITSANLTLTQWIFDSPPGDPIMRIDRIKTSWDEGTITYATAYDDPSFVVTNPTTYNVSMGENTFDVTSIVQDWLSGSANYGIRLKKDFNYAYNYEYFRSTEYATANERPKLTVAW